MIRPFGLSFLLITVLSFASEQSAKIIFVGDIMLDRLPGKFVALGRDPFEFVAPILSKADLRIGNLEFVVSGRGNRFDKPYTFKASSSVLRPILKHLDAVSLANNHTGDYGHEGLLDTKEALIKLGVQVFGAGKDATTAHTPLIVERNGIRIAILGYNEFRPRAFQAKEKTPGVAWSDDDLVLKDIQSIRPSADIVVTFMHWGEEYVAHPNNRQKELARKMIDAGADAVVGNHPHITQGTEVYRNKPIVYSLGNFIFDDFADSYRENRLELREISRTSWILSLTVNKNGVIDWSTTVARTGDDGFPRVVPFAESPSKKSPYPTEQLISLNKADPKKIEGQKINCTESTKWNRCIGSKLSPVNVEVLRLQTTQLERKGPTMSDSSIYQLDRAFFESVEQNVQSQVIRKVHSKACDLIELDFNIRYEYPDPSSFSFGLKRLQFLHELEKIDFPIENSFREVIRASPADHMLLKWLSEGQALQIRGEREDSNLDFEMKVPVLKPFDLSTDSKLIPGKSFGFHLIGLSDEWNVRAHWTGYSTMKNFGYYVDCLWEKPNSLSFKIPEEITRELPHLKVPQSEIHFGIEVFRQIPFDTKKPDELIVLERNHRISSAVPIRFHSSKK